MQKNAKNIGKSCFYYQILLFLVRYLDRAVGRGAAERERERDDGGSNHGGGGKLKVGNCRGNDPLFFIVHFKKIVLKTTQSCLVFNH